MSIILTPSCYVLHVVHCLFTSHLSAASAMFVCAKCHLQCAQQLFGQQALEENRIKLT